MGLLKLGACARVAPSGRAQASARAAIRAPDLAVNKASGGPLPVRWVGEARTILAERSAATVRQAAAEAGLTCLASRPAWREHAFGSYRDADDDLLTPHSQYRLLESDTVLIRSGCFEIDRRFLLPTLHGLTFENAAGGNLRRRCGGDQPTDADAARFLDKWLAMRQGRRDGLDPIDGFQQPARRGLARRGRAGPRPLARGLGPARQLGLRQGGATRAVARGAHGRVAAGGRWPAA